MAPHRPVRRRLLLGLHGGGPGRGRLAQGRRGPRPGAGARTARAASPSPRPSPRPRHAITLYMNEAGQEFLEPDRIRQIVKRYSDHIALPVELLGGAKRETLNAASALWTRPKTEITELQYKEFYRHVAHSFDDPWLTLHYRAEGKLDYSALLFVPSHRPFDLFDPDRKGGLQALCQARLHHRRLPGASAALSALPARHRRFRGSAAQCQPRDAAEEPAPRPHPPGSRQAAARPAREEDGHHRVHVRVRKLGSRGS